MSDATTKKIVGTLFPEIDKMLAENLANNPHLPPLVGLVALARAMSDAFLDDYRLVQPVPNACSAGCASCCYLYVTVHASEAAELAYAIADEPELIEAVYLTAALRVGKGPKELHQQLIPCPFLDLSTMACRVYPIRPLTCRGYHSIDRQACEAGLGVTAGVPQFREPLAITIALQAAVLNNDHPGAVPLPGRVGELSQMVSAALLQLAAGEHHGFGDEEATIT